ncbi:MAG: hypothetical protein ABIO36_05790 [Pyrinomonadaceae bacterium]
MSVIDLMIIYLACGSPFGVYQITKSQNDHGSRDWLVIIASFLLWPGFAASLLIDRLVSKNEGDEEGSGIEHFRTEIERLGFSGESASSVFEFREVFYRFTGLIEAANSKQPNRSANELFEVSGHVNKTLASNCLGRRNREKLVYHQTQARNEFVDIIAEMANDEARREEITVIALELTDYLNDDAATSDLTALLARPAKPNVKINPIAA